MRKFIAIALVFTMALGLTACAGGGSEIHRLNMATGGDAGTYYAFGGVIASVLTNKIENVEVTAQTSGGSIDNARKLKNKEAEIAFMQNDVLQYAVTGTESMKDDGAMENLCAIASLYPEAVQLSHQVQRHQDHSGSQGQKGMRRRPGLRLRGERQPDNCGCRHELLRL